MMKGAMVAWVRIKIPQADYEGLVAVDPGCDTDITFNEPEGWVLKQYQKVVVIPLEDT